jgi:hypothetical protein
MMTGAAAVVAALFFLAPGEPTEASLIRLASTEYVATQEDRQFLKFLARCAMPDGLVVESNSIWSLSL